MNRSLFEEANFVLRAEALEALEHRDDPALRAELEAVDARLFARLREEIRSGRCRGAELLRTIRSYVPESPRRDERYGGRYDPLDTFMAELLLTRPLPEETRGREAEMVFYQRTPSRVVFELASHVRANDVFYDVGSGLGEVVLVIHLLTAARAKGIEIEPAYCEYARALAADLNAGVTFVNADARHADVSDGTVFFLYRPFVGRMLEEVRARLHGRVVTYDFDGTRGLLR